MKIRSTLCWTLAVPLLFWLVTARADDPTPVPNTWSPDGKHWYPGAAPSNWRQYNNPNTTQPRQTQQPSGLSQEEIARNAAADYANQQGLQAAAIGDWDTAIKDFQDALNNRPGDAAIQKNLADAQQRKRDAEHAAFNADKQQALANLKGISSGDSLQLKTISSANPSLGLKGLDNSSAFSQLKGGNSFDNSPKSDFPANEWKDLKPATTAPASSTPLPYLDASVVDARNVPTGLPKSVQDAIPLTPAGDRVRKGFQAAMQRDWKVALAWFQDALNQQPGDPALQQLVDFAQFSLDNATQTHTLPFENNSTPALSTSAKDDPDSDMSESMKQALNDWADKNLRQPQATSNQQLKPEDPAWTKFVSWLNDNFGPKKEKDPQAVGAARG